MKKNYRPENLDELKKLKLNKEIDNLELKAKALGKWRFRWGSIYVPIIVAGITIWAVYSTGILDASSKLNEINKKEFEKDSANRNMQIRLKTLQIDSLSLVKDSLSAKVDQLRLAISEIKRSYKSIHDSLNNDNKLVSTMTDENISLKSEIKIKEDSLRELNRVYKIDENSLTIVYDKLEHMTLAYKEQSEKAAQLENELNSCKSKK